MPGKLQSSGGKYLRIVGGKLVQKVDQKTEGARYREYELANGEKGSKYELVYMNWEGRIIGITFKENDYGEECIIALDDVNIVLNVSSRYFSDFACKLLSGDLKKAFVFHPYEIETENGKKSGISLQQDGQKLKNYFYDFENKKKLHGFPEVDETKKERKSYWKIYFVEVAEFLVDKLKALSFEGKIMDKTTDGFEEDIGNGNDLPFG